jgi:hypothetical protein
MSYRELEPTDASGKSVVTMIHGPPIRSQSKRAQSLEGAGVFQVQPKNSETANPIRLVIAITAALRTAMRLASLVDIAPASDSTRITTPSRTPHPLKLIGMAEASIPSTAAASATEKPTPVLTHLIAPQYANTLSKVAATLAIKT